MKMPRILVYAAVLLSGLLLVQRVSSRDASTDDLVNQAGQFVPVLMLVVAGIITYQARLRGASQGLALGIPLAIQVIIAFGLVEPGSGRVFLLMMLVPMVAVCLNIRVTSQHSTIPFLITRKYLRSLFRSAA